MSFVFGSVCSGMEAASLAWKPLGARCAFVAEIDTAACQLLAERFPDVPNLGDLTKWRDWPHELLAQIDVLIGGTPCQGFSFAGLRKSLSDDRSNLALEFLELADAIDALRRTAGRPALIIVWENVPGVYSSSDNAFGCFLGAIVGADAPLVPGRRQKWTHAGVADGPARRAAWRTLDAQFFGLAQRRARVFVIASAGAVCPATVLLERASVRGNPRPSREAGQDIAGTLGGSSQSGGYRTTDLDGTGAFIPVEIGCPVAFDPTQITHPENRSNPQPGEPVSTLGANQHAPAIAFAMRGRDEGNMPEIHDTGETVSALRSESGGSTRDLVALADNVVRWAVRRLTPRETERLQGAPDDHTLVRVKRVLKNNLIIAAAHDAKGEVVTFGKPGHELPYQAIDGEVWQLMADTHRYKLVGNSKAIPVVSWIGARIILAREAA